MNGKNLILTSAFLALATANPAFAQTAADVEALQRQIEELRAQQAAQTEQLRQTDQRISEIEQALESFAGGTAPAVNAAPSMSAAAAAPSPTESAPRLRLSGDLRLRYEGNFGIEGAPDRNRAVMRARLRGAYEVADWATLGAQISTGDPDDPKTTDVTLSNWNDDLQVSLDQAYLDLTFGDLHLYGGKFPNPFFRSSEIVWDGDVSIAGFGAVHRLAIADGLSASLIGAYFTIDERSNASDSDMSGVQLALEARPHAHWRIELASALYNYRLDSVVGADTGDFRSNLIGLDGRYVSDFELIDTSTAATFTGFGAHWPVRFAGEYVVNQGAVNDANTGYSMDLSAGRIGTAGDLRFALGYSAVETEAVLAAFSHNNLDLATNYLAQTLALDYSLRSNIILNATLFHYRPLSAAFAGTLDPNDWRDRLRLNFLVTF